MRRPAAFIALLTAGSLVSLSLVSVLAAPQSDAARAPSDRERELAVIRAEIEELQGRLGELRERELGLEGRLAEIDLSLKLQQRRTEEAVAARELAAERATAAQTAVDRLEEDLEEARRSLRRRLAGLYRLGQQGYLRLVLAAEPGADVLSALRMIRFLARRDRRDIDRYTEVRTELAAERDELVARREEVESWTRREEARRRELAALRRRQAGLLAEAEQERRHLAARAVELAEQERKLSALLDGLYGRSDVPLAGTAMQEFQGVLDWPVPGELTVGFGPRRDPRYRTQVPHNGIELATDPGAAVKTIYPGKVLFASPFPGYGPTVVVHHPGRIFTLYAGLERLQAREDDVLSLGQVLGTAADRLYFEVRVENRPQDPLDWLRQPPPLPSASSP